MPGLWSAILAAAPQQEADSGKPEEITVTAEHWSDGLQSVPILKTSESPAGVSQHVAVAAACRMARAIRGELLKVESEFQLYKAVELR